jgi:hypothetical protein
MSVLAFYPVLIGCVSATAQAPTPSGETATRLDQVTVHSFVNEFQKVTPPICRNDQCSWELHLDAKVDGQNAELVIRLEKNSHDDDKGSLSFKFFNPTRGWLLITDDGLNGSVDVFITVVRSVEGEKVSYSLSSCYDAMIETTCGDVTDRFTENAKDGFYGHAVTNFLKALQKIPVKLIDT